MERTWGIIYLLSGIFAFVIALWKFPIVYSSTYVILMEYYVIFLLIIELIFSFLFIGLGARSIQYARRGLDGEESTSFLSKVFVLLSNLYQVSMIIITVFHLSYW
jgi:hypothetical protein